MTEKYKCSFCGVEYDEPVARAQCEIKCDEKQKREVERLRLEQKKREQKSRGREVSEAYNKLVELCKAYTDDYGPVVFASSEAGRRYLPFDRLLDLMFLP